MQYAKTENRYLIRLLKDESFNEKLLEFCTKENIKTAFFYGLGGVLSAELAFYNLDTKEYQIKKFNQTMEIVSLTGNIMLVEQKPFIHAHIALSDDNYQCYGGHLKNATIGGTCEILMTNTDLGLEREMDTETGLKLINCTIK